MLGSLDLEPQGVFVFGGAMVGDPGTARDGTEILTTGDFLAVGIFGAIWANQHRRWHGLNGSWTIYHPHVAFDIDGTTQDSEPSTLSYE